MERETTDTTTRNLANRTRPFDAFALGLFALLTVAFALGASWRSSYVFNENGRLASGIMRLVKRDFTAFRVNPPLTDAFAAAPAIFIRGAYCPQESDFVRVPFGRCEYEAGEAFVEKTPNDLLFLRLGRASMIPFALLGLCACYFYGRFLYGKIGGVIAAFLWVFSPFVIGYGSTIGADMPSAALAITTVGLFHRWLNTRDPQTLLFTGLILGVAELCKFTLLALYPLLLTLWALERFVRPRDGAPKNARQSVGAELASGMIWVVGVSMIVLNLGYLFTGTFKPLGEYRFHSLLFTGAENADAIPSDGANRFAETTLGKIPVPLPEDYVLGLDAQRFDFERGMRSYMRGTWREQGWFLYYVYALTIKTPPCSLILFVWALLSVIIRRGRKISFDESVVWLSGLFFLLFVSSQTGFSIHSRYVLPALPFFFTASSRIAFYLRNENNRIQRTTATLAATLCLTTALGVLNAFPHELSYFNALTPVFAKSGERPNEPELTSTGLQGLRERFDRTIMSAAPKCLLDSNLDWGQDALRLEDWLKTRPELGDITVKLWSNGDYVLCKRDSRFKIERRERTTPTLAISVNFLYNKIESYRWLWNKTPLAVAGKTIYVYRLSEDDWKDRDADVSANAKGEQAQ